MFNEGNWDRWKDVSRKFTTKFKNDTDRHVWREKARINKRRNYAKKKKKLSRGARLVGKVKEKGS